MELLFVFIFFLVIHPESISQPKSAPGIKDSPKEEVFGFEYFPLRNATSFLFESNIGVTKAVVYNEGNEMVFAYDAGNISYKQNLIRQANGIYLTKVQSKAYFFGSCVTYNKPVLRLPLPIKLYDTWTWEGYEIVDGDSSKITLKGKALGVEIIKTKAGEFRCLKVLINIISAKGSTNSEIEWLAPDIGIVRVKAKIEGGGISGMLQKLLGLDEIKFSINQITKN